MKDRHCSQSPLPCRRMLQIAWLMLAVALVGTPLYAQSGAGAIHGTIQDSSGAVIPGAAVHVVNQATNQVFDTKTNSAGLYTVPALFTGNYTVTFSAPGMASFQRSISLQTAQNAVIDVKLHPGGVNQKIVVHGNVVQLATYDSPTISDTLDSQRINQLPMNGRSLETLNILTTPGLESSSVGLRVNGNMAAATEYVQDGATLADRNFGSNYVTPDPDSVQEVHFETSNSSAKYATPGAAVITTKSGTNHWHGSFFETARNNYFGIAKARQDPSNYAAPHLVRNEFGLSAGGPVILPKLYDGRNKTFWFVAYERYSLAQSVSGQFTVPTQAMRNGDYSGLTNGSGIFQQLYDPSTTAASANCNGSGVANQYCRAPMQYNGQNNVINPGLESPLAKLLYQITPLPTASLANVNPLASFNYIAEEPNVATVPTLTTRVDHTFDENNRAYVRYTQTASHTLSWNATDPGPPNVAGSGLAANTDNMQLSVNNQDNAAIGYTHIFSPTLFAESVISGTWQKISDGGNTNPLTNYRTEWGLPSNFGPADFGVTGLLANYQMNADSYESSSRIFNFDENVTKTLGRHQLYFGLRYRFEHMGVLPDQQSSFDSFNGMGTGLLNPSTGTTEGITPNTGRSDADFFLGYASSYADTLTGRRFNYHDQELDLYVQDDWHISPKWTANLGLRWEAHPAPVELNGQNNGFDLANDAIVTPVSINTLIARGSTTQSLVNALESVGVKFETAPVAGIPSSMIFNSYVFAPRLGLAFAPWGTRGTVFRGGFGRYVYPIPLRNFYATQANPPNAPYGYDYSQSFTNQNDSSAQYSDGLPNYILRHQQQVVAGQNSANVVDYSSAGVTPGSINNFFMTPKYPPNIVSQGSFTVEQPLKWDSVLRISWDYDHGSNLDQYNYFNYGPSAYVWMAQTDTAPPSNGNLYNTYDQNTYNSTGLIQDQRNGWSTDNSLQANFERQYKNGWAFQIFYVYSKAFRVGGNTFRDGNIQPIGDYLPGTFPGQAGLQPWASPKWLDRVQNYQPDSAIPEHRIRANGIYDLPFGRGKRFLGHVNRFVDELVGGYQIAGDMNLNSQYFQVNPDVHWGGDNPLNSGTLGKVHLYGKKSHPVEDCTSGTCYKGYQLFNGFINPLLVNDPCGPSPYSGLSTETPYITPIITDPGTVTCNGTSIQTSNPYYLYDAVSYDLTNKTTVPLTTSANGTTVIPAYYDGGPYLNPYAKAFYLGPFNWTADMSLFKVFPIGERMNLRVNVDAFNVFNMQGSNNPNGETGIQYFTSSYNTPRQIQLTARFTF